MEKQLFLVEPADLTEPPWALDHRTKDIGRRGLEQARQALRRATRQAA